MIGAEKAAIPTVAGTAMNAIVRNPKERFSRYPSVSPRENLSESSGMRAVAMATMKTPYGSWKIVNA